MTVIGPNVNKIITSPRAIYLKPKTKGGQVSAK